MEVLPVRVVGRQQSARGKQIGVLPIAGAVQLRYLLAARPQQVLGRDRHEALRRRAGVEVGHRALGHPRAAAVVEIAGHAVGNHVAHRAHPVFVVVQVLVQAVAGHVASRRVARRTQGLQPGDLIVGVVGGRGRPRA